MAKTIAFPFDIERAKQGAKIITRNGLNVKIVAYDKKNKSYPITALVERTDGVELLIEYAENGCCCYNESGLSNNFDLFIEEKNPSSPSIIQAWWREMRFEVYAQASGNRHAPNYSDECTKMFSLIDIDELIEELSERGY